MLGVETSLEVVLRPRFEMCLQALIRSLTDDEHELAPKSIDLGVCLCDLNHDYNFPSYVFINEF